MTTSLLTLVVNGQPVEIYAEHGWTLLHVLRNHLGLTGTKENCLEGECGVCTVLLDGKAVNACIVLAHQCIGAAITTIEGFAPRYTLSELPQAFVERGAVQCGYCIPGMILTAKSFLDENPSRTFLREELREAICGTLCRCTGYQKIIDAITDEALNERRRVGQDD